jgi:DNA-binding LacI/PurR family transcriptional regulator
MIIVKLQYCQFNTVSEEHEAMARKRKTSMQDIADTLNISKNAVSLALMNRKGVSEEMRERILQMAKEMHYGSYAETGSAANILILIPERIMSDHDDEHFLFYHDLVWGLEKSVREKGLNPVIARIDRDMEQNLLLPKVYEDIAFYGIILFGIVRRDYAQMVWERDRRLILFDSYYRDIPCPAVTSANVEGACAGVTHLIDSGHRRIGFIGPVNLTTSHEERWWGYTKAMMDRGLPIDPDLCLTRSAGLAATADEIRAYWHNLKEKPSAVFCGNDRIALLLFDHLRRCGMHVPDDVSVMGFDDLKQSAQAEPALSTLRVDKSAMCAAAVELLPFTHDHSSPMIKWGIIPELVNRNSVRPLLN